MLHPELRVLSSESAISRSHSLVEAEGERRGAGGERALAASMAGGAGRSSVQDGGGEEKWAAEC